MRFVISGGGTGGGIYPALAVVEALKAKHSDADILWIGSVKGPEREIVTRSGIEFKGVNGGPIVGIGARAIKSLPRLAHGTMQARSILAKFRPNVTMSTGGWPTFPATLASWGRCPIAIYMPDTEPGSTIKYLSRIADRVAVTSEASIAFFPQKAVVTGYPLRAPLLHAAGFNSLGEALPNAETSREYAQTRFGLLADLPTVLIWGGSKGARSINEAMLAHLPTLLENCQIIHISGTLDWDGIQARTTEITQSLSSEIATRYHGFAYLHSEDMALALAASDLSVSRAGASALGEFPLFGIPAILVPYPYAWRYQKTNADTLAARGAAIRLDDERLMGEMAATIQRLLAAPDDLARMSAAMRSMARPDAATRIADLLVQIAK